jgi:hypothetical protein
LGERRGEEGVDDVYRASEFRGEDDGGDVPLPFILIYKFENKIKIK